MNTPTANTSAADLHNSHLLTVLDDSELENVAGGNTVGDILRGRGMPLPMPMPDPSFPLCNAPELE